MSDPRSRVATALGLPAAALAFILAAVPSVSAATLLKESGDVGPHVVVDSHDSPGGLCGYGTPNDRGVARFVWMKVLPPEVYARDVTPARDRQPIEWRVRLQLARAETGPWTTVTRSDWERARAYDDMPADLDLRPTKVRHSSRGIAWYRGVITIRWLRQGVNEGAVSLALDHYAVKWTVGDPAFVFDGPCWNKAD